MRLGLGFLFGFGAKNILGLFFNYFGGQFRYLDPFRNNLFSLFSRERESRVFLARAVCFLCFFGERKRVRVL